MRILFIGETKGNIGPSNVNKGIVQNLTAGFWHIKTENKYVQMVEALGICLFSDVVVVSGLSKQGMFLTGFAKSIGKKVVYIMHGCVAYEAVVNQQKNVEAALRQEQYMLENADLLLPVSRKFSKWVCSRYPQYTSKTKYLFNGIDTAFRVVHENARKIKGAIAAAGADRGVKNNIVVARAVEGMKGEAMLTVYGTIYHKPPAGFRYSQYIDRIPRSDFLKRLQETELFVVNSVFETFSISAVEALFCGCSILISENVGVTDLLALEECDIIHDPMDEEEIRTKIEYLLEHPNNQRILDKLDIDEYSYAKQVERLEAMCRELIEKP